MEKKTLVSAGKECIIYRDQDPECLLIQPIEKDHTETLDHQVEVISAGSEHSILFAAFKVGDWNREMPPWAADPAFGTEPFGSGAGETLRYIEEILIPDIRSEYGLTDGIPVILGGYSLAALFSLWSAYQTGIFSGIAAVSPSVWFPGWMDYAETHTIRTDFVYLSLGDKEERTKNIIMSAVGDCIRKQHGLLEGCGINCVLEWNKGNHFVNPDIRTAKGFVWCLNSMDSAETLQGKREQEKNVHY